MQPSDRILAAIDLSATSSRVLGTAVDLAVRLEARLVVLHVSQEQAEATTERIENIRSDEDLCELTNKVEELLGNLDLPRWLSPIARIAQGRPSTEIIEVLKEQPYSFAVIGVRNRSRVGKFLLGSNSQDVLLNAPCPVVAVPL